MTAASTVPHCRLAGQFENGTSARRRYDVAIHPMRPNFTIGGTQDNGQSCCALRHWRRTDLAMAVRAS